MSRIKKIIEQVELFTPLFRKAKETHDLFHQVWSENHPKFGTGIYKQDVYLTALKIWQKAHIDVHNRIIPIYEELKQGNTNRIETALAYVSIPIQYFRSGYMKEKIYRILKRISLDDEYKEFLRSILI